MIRRILCALGFHEYENQEHRVAVGYEGWLVLNEKVCKHCGYSPTWVR